MSANDLAFLTIAELAPKIKSREVSPVEVTRAILDRIEKYDSKLHSYITLLPERAIGAAYAAEKAISSGVYLGPLHGVPIALKDLFDTEGIRTTAGSESRKDHLPGQTATAAARLAEAGTILLGKLNMMEFAYGGSGVNPYFGTARTPWDVSRVAGGSSSGSGSAVAAGLATAALGTDTGGSVRIPASLCGIVGLKPTYGRVSTFGVVPLSWTLDSVGPMTRCVEDAAIMFKAIVGPDSHDPTTLHQPPFEIPPLTGDVRGMSLGVPKEWFYDDLDPDVAKAVPEAINMLAKIGASTVEVEMPHLSDEAIRRSTIVPAEAFTYHEEVLSRRPEQFGPVVRGRIEAGMGVTATQYIRALQARQQLMREARLRMAHIDALVTPTTRIPSLRVEENEERMTELIHNTWPVNWMGLSAITVPCGFTSGGLPVSLQIIGKPYDEGAILQIAYAYEHNTDWHRRRPPL
jgi:aspartyl-tRNA(Asn)/glutamyl-tRNA(Gln) amidotransferase subunit A